MRGLTKYQLETLVKLREIEAETAKLVDMDQLLLTLSWKPSKESAQFTIRALAARGFIEKMPLEFRRGRNRVCYRLTREGQAVLDPRLLGTSKATAPAEGGKFPDSGVVFDDGFDGFDGEETLEI